MELKCCIYGKLLVKSDYVKVFYWVFGYWLKYFFKSKEVIDCYLKVLVDLYIYEEDGVLYYWANIWMKEMKGQFLNGNVVCKLKLVDNSCLFSDFLLEILAVNFVCINVFMVLFFLFKLFWEYVKMVEKLDSSIFFDLS